MPLCDRCDRESKFLYVQVGIHIVFPKGTERRPFQTCITCKDELTRAREKSLQATTAPKKPTEKYVKREVEDLDD